MVFKKWRKPEKSPQKIAEGGALFDAGGRVFSPANPPSWNAVTNKPTVISPGTTINSLGFSESVVLHGAAPLAFQSHGGSLYMSDSTWLRVGGNKKFYLTAGGDDAIKLEHGGIWCKGNVTAYSDERLKKDIRPIYNATELVRKLRGYTYEFKIQEKAGVRSYGVLAQETQKVMPEIVKDEGEFLGVQYSQFIAVLIEAIKEIDIRLTALERA